MNVVPLPRPAAARKPNTEKHRVTKRLEFFAIRCFELADRVAAGNIPFIEAVDLAYSAAVWADLPAAIEASGLIDYNKSGVPTGDDVIQHTISVAFAHARAPQ